MYCDNKCILSLNITAKIFIIIIWLLWHFKLHNIFLNRFKQSHDLIKPCPLIKCSCDTAWWILISLSGIIDDSKKILCVKWTDSEWKVEYRYLQRVNNYNLSDISTNHKTCKMYYYDCNTSINCYFLVWLLITIYNFYWLLGP